VSILKPETSLTVGLATAALVYGIYSNALPTVADIRVGQADDADIAGSEQAAAWTAAAAVAAVSLIAQDPTVFVIGGSMLVVLSWLHRHANQVNPLTGVASFIGGADAGMFAADDDAQAA
jgi:hypothetical protein